jgi:non-ribosomal peptide synthetase component F
LPIDPSVPDPRISILLSVSGCKTLISSSNLKPRLINFENTNIICVDELASETGTISVSPTEISGDDLCYIIFTSGSTGAPKGVEIMHKSVVNVLDSFRNLCTPQDVLLATTTISFDISILEIFLPLSVGAELVIANQSISKDGQQLNSYINQIKPTIMQGKNLISIIQFQHHLRNPIYVATPSRC